MNSPSAQNGLSERIQQAASLIYHAQYGVALTGAGISTPSGIPDFRSAGSGLWTRYLPMEVASLHAFHHHPERFFEWLRPLAGQMLNAKPNPAHKSLASLEEAHHLKAIITQNIDTLHQRAGSTRILEVHGTFETLSCLGCYQQIKATSKLIKEYMERGIIPRCEHCQRILKPDVVLFGEQLPFQIWKKAQKATRACDLMIVVGSSLTVSPVADLPAEALRRGANLIILNKMETYLDQKADIVIHQDVAKILPEITRSVLYDY